jgi:uncharacterized UBP type Zn finger protein
MLVDMGFEEHYCRRALIRHRNDLEMAMNYLLEERHLDEDQNSSGLSDDDNE